MSIDDMNIITPFRVRDIKIIFYIILCFKCSVYSICAFFGGRSLVFD